VPYTGPGAPANNSKAVAALVCGIAGIVFAFCCGPIGIALGIVGIVLGYLSKQEIQRSAGTQGGGQLAQGGLITGIVAIVLAVIMMGIGAATNLGNFGVG
jgi:hypothetical protein